MAKETSKLDLKKLKQLKTPLAKVVEILVEGKTARDNPAAIAEDIAIGLEAQDPASHLANALGKYSTTAKTEKDIEKDLKELMQKLTPSEEKKKPK